MDTVYEAALARQEELQRELKELNDFIALYRRTRQRLGLDSVEHKEIDTAEHERQSVSPDVLPAQENNSIEIESPRKRVTDNPKPADVVQASMLAIMAQERPLSRRELYEELKNMGMEVRGVDPVKTLGTMLWRSGQDDLIQLEGLGYWVRSEPYPAANYTPASPDQVEIEKLLS